MCFPRGFWVAFQKVVPGLGRLLIASGKHVEAVSWGERSALGIDSSLPWMRGEVSQADQLADPKHMRAILRSIRRRPRKRRIRNLYNLLIVLSDIQRWQRPFLDARGNREG